jgi:hypothetical protein
MAELVHPGQAVFVRAKASGERLAMAHGLLDRFLTWATKSLDPVYMHDQRSGVISAIYINQHLNIPVAVIGGIEREDPVHCSRLNAKGVRHGSTRHEARSVGRRHRG